MRLQKMPEMILFQDESQVSSSLSAKMRFASTSAYTIIIPTNAIQSKARILIFHIGNICICLVLRSCISSSSYFVLD